MMHHDPNRPIADGIPFDDCEAIGLSTEQCNFLAMRGVVWSTSFMSDATTFGGTVIAPTEEAAARIAFGRGLGEVIDGPVLATITCDLSMEQIEEMKKRFPPKPHPF